MNKVLAIVLMLFSFSALAQENTFSLNLPVMSYSQSVIDPGEVKTNDLTTSQRERAWLSAVVDQFIFYYYPFDTGRTVSAGYLMGMYEVGIDLGLNHLRSSPPKDELNTNTYGLYVGMFPKLTSKVNGEFYLVADQIFTKGSQEDSRVDLYRLSADLTYPLSPKVTYVGGLSYTGLWTRDYYNGGSVLVRTLGVNVASLRLSF